MPPHVNRLFLSLLPRNGEHLVEGRGVMGEVDSPADEKDESKYNVLALYATPMHLCSAHLFPPSARPTTTHC